MLDQEARFFVESSSAFEEDLDAAARYRFQTAGKQSALKLLDSYEDAIDRLELFPTYGPRLRGSLRWCEIDNLVAIYEVDSKSRRVVMHRLYNMTSDWKRRILDETKQK